MHVFVPYHILVFVFVVLVFLLSLMPVFLLYYIVVFVYFVLVSVLWLMLVYAIYHILVFGQFAQVFLIVVLFSYMMHNTFFYFVSFFVEIIMVESHFIVSWYPIQVIYPFEEQLFHIHIVHQVLHDRMSSERVVLIRHVPIHKYMKLHLQYYQISWVY